jgi:plastocyanin
VVGTRGGLGARHAGRRAARLALGALVLGALFAPLLGAIPAAAPADSTGRAPTPGPAPAPAPDAPPTPEPTFVHITATGLQPASVQLSPGATVVWINDSSTKKSVVASDQSFDSGPLAKGDRFQFAFTEPRTIAYNVPELPGVQGMVIVAAPAASPAPAPAPQPSGFAFTGSGAAITAVVGGLVLAFGAALVLTAHRMGVTISQLVFAWGPDDLLPSRRSRRRRRARARGGRFRR